MHAAPVDHDTVMDDDAWDAAADAELDALAESTVPGTAPPWVRPLHLPPPDREYDRQLAVLTADGAGEFLRACRAWAGLSQRALAAAAGVTQATVARIEADRSPGVTVATMAKLVGACDLLLVATESDHTPLLHTDLAQRHHDRSGRMLPAHLFNAPYVTGTLEDSRRGRRGVPVHTYEHRRVKDVPDT